MVASSSCGRRPRNVGINLGFGDGSLRLDKLQTPGTVNHTCIRVDDGDADRLPVKCKELGVSATVDRNLANRTSGGDQLFIQTFDNQLLQIGAHGNEG